MFRLLIVEDESIIAMSLQFKLTDKGYQVLPIAKSADEAVNYTRQFKPDVILMDILLQGEQTGIDAACRILADYTIPIIYLTGNQHLLQDDRLKKYDLKVINKPPSDWQLFAELEKLKSKSRF